ncbi:unnamed protein product [Timema podura]|uniref:UBX domain-containing protein n=1 Tax=Timema podura TaxID=61482 RepID=A0ABN7NND8_TIMPD|nr:unnamed protein product [Timema podura]
MPVRSEQVLDGASYYRFRLLAHGEETSLPCPPQADEGTEQEGGEETVDVAKSIKCNDVLVSCLLAAENCSATQVEVEFHAAKTNHSNFSESKEEKRPLSEEEKREQLRKLEDKMRQKRLEREEGEKKEALERERLRIKSGKEITAAKKKMEDEEMKKLLELRKREKLEEKMARQRVKDQIEQDKVARRAKFGGPKVEPPPPAVTQPSQQAVAKDYLQTRLQIRLTNGQALTQTFGSKEQLSAVRLFVEMNRTDGNDQFSLMTSFPKKIFSEEDYDKPLEVLGLVPSAVVIVSRQQ